MSNKLALLRHFIVEHYSLEEIRTFCFDLGINYDDLGGEGLSAKVRELLLRLGRERQFDQLLDILHQTRPQPFHQSVLNSNAAFIDQLYLQLPSISTGKPRPRDERIMLEKVETFWIKGVLENSLYGAVLIELGKEYRLEAIDYPWEMVVQQANSRSQVLPKNKGIKDVFEEAGQSILILGEPGSGKTTMLLELARALITRAKQDPDLPVPVVFNLSSWQGGKLIMDWLADELKEKYLIPKKIGQKLVKKDKLTLLLDGLDEVNPKQQAACVGAINQFRQEQLAGVAICSRIKEYEIIADKLKLQSAVFLQPLTEQQIDEYLSSGDSKLALVCTALKNDVYLMELAHSPLMLSVITLAYQDISAGALSLFDSVEDRRQHMLDAYTRQMFKRRPAKSIYSEKQTRYWLSWLAQRLVQHDQTVFLIEQMQPSWLSTHGQRWIYLIVSRLIGSIIAGSLLGLFFPGMIAGLIAGLVVIFIDARQFNVIGKDSVPMKSSFFWRTTRNVLGLGLIFGMVIYIGLAGWTFDSLFFLFFMGLTFGLIFGLRAGKRSVTNDIQAVESLGWSWRRGLGVTAVGTFVGLILVIVSGGGMRSGLYFGSLFGLGAGIIAGLRRSTLEKKASPNLGITLYARNVTIVFWITFLSFSLIFWLIGLVVYGQVLRLFEGVFFGAIIATLAALWQGGLDIIQHYTLRFLLYINACIPWNYARFLDSAVERVFLRKVGSGYIFIHRLFMDYFAEIETE